jgi:hypothetical protein
MAPRVSAAARAAALLLLSALLASAASGCGAKKGVSLGYDDSYASIIVQVKHYGGLPSPIDDLAPSFELRGDGTVITRAEGGLSQPLLRGKMQAGDVEDLLARIRESGFFDLQTWYYNDQARDGTFTEMQVNLSEANHKVVCHMAEVPALQAALEAVSSAPVELLEDYRPGRGFLLVEGHQASAADVVIDASSEVYGLLPPSEVLRWAAASHQPLGLNGQAFQKIKRYASDRAAAGLVVAEEESRLIIYPVYEPR